MLGADRRLDGVAMVRWSSVLPELIVDLQWCQKDGRSTSEIGEEKVLN